MAILATAFKNRIKKNGGENFEFHLRNISVNGVKHGCSGFIVNPTNGKTVYVNTEGTDYEPLGGKVVFREARNLKDYSGGRNRWADVKNDAYVFDIITFLND